MANKNITIPITNGADVMSYLVEWKLSTDVNYVNNTQFSTPIVIYNVLDNSLYDVRITGTRLNGCVTNPLVLSVDTTSNSPQLATPTGHTFTAGVGEIVHDCNDVVNATHYVFELAQDEEFTIAFQEVISATSTNTWTGLTAATIYYGRVKARASGYADSAYTGVLNATPS